MLANYLTSFGGYQTAVWDGKGRGTLEFKVQSSGVQGIEFRVQSSGYSHLLVSEQLNPEPLTLNSNVIHR